MKGRVVARVDAISPYKLENMNETVGRAIGADRGTEGLRAGMYLVQTFQAWLRHISRLTSYPTGGSVLNAFALTLCQEGIMGDSEKTHNPGLFLDFYKDWLSFIRASDEELGGGARAVEVIRLRLENTEDFLAVQREFQANIPEADLGLHTMPSETLICLAIQSSKGKFFHSTASLNARQRAFFTTENGYMGLGSTDIRVDDYVALISGFKVPMVIRPEGSAWRVVGPTFMYGIMHGELWDASSLQRFVLV